MTKNGRKKPKVVEDDSDAEFVEVLSVVKNKIVYEDTKEITGSKPKLKWVQIYPMVVERKVLEAGLGDLALYENILRSGITKIGPRPEMFPCTVVIGWMVPKKDTIGMMINDEEGNPVASFAPAFISIAYSLPET